MATATTISGRRSLLLPLLLVVSLAGAIKLSDRLMDYVLRDFGQEAHQRLQDWQRLHRIGDAQNLEH